MGVIILLFLLIYFGLAFFFAHEFYVVACDKGYNSSKYYWICFWFGIVGYLLVIALPTKPQADMLTSPQPPTVLRSTATARPPRHATLGH